MKYLKNANNIKVGDKFRYRSRGYTVDGLSYNAGTEYDATVIYITKYLIGLRLLCDQLTLHTITFGPPQPYDVAIRKVDVGRTERLYLPEM